MFFVAALKTALQMLARLVRVNHAMKYGFYVNGELFASAFLPPLTKEHARTT